jgi:hypothetical protein
MLRRLRKLIERFDDWFVEWCERGEPRTRVVMRPHYQERLCPECSQQIYGEPKECRNCKAQLAP